MAFYFPLHKRLRALLRIPGFRRMLEHEYTRPRPAENIVSDVYDSPSWKKIMGEPAQPCKRIGLLGCTDGFQAHNCGSLGLNPVEFAMLSLPPALRFKTEFILLMMLLPPNLKGFGLKKYFDYAAKYELNRLYYRGS